MKLSATVVNLYHITLSPLTDERAISINNIGKDLIRTHPQNINLMTFVREAAVQVEDFELEGLAVQSILFYRPEHKEVLEALDYLDTFGVDIEMLENIMFHAGVDYKEGVQALAAEIAETKNEAIAFKPI